MFLVVEISLAFLIYLQRWSQPDSAGEAVRQIWQNCVTSRIVEISSLLFTDFSTGCGSLHNSLISQWLQL